MKIEIDLTERQWAELVSAVVAKRDRVADGVYDLDEVHDLDDNWVVELDTIYRVVTAALDDKGVTR